ncbi:hypothetical protein [Nonomuraea basaltis]|uniref:hypothetical protein n=1 Tax=Nonomuraea basaltis TaxID=2495887 RepID=UPI00110C5841|nr:hypothetical protein [Nonomuraea basaltis]TMR99587.1 hypothetical protein EJK15_07170 [Nonomuraea basaltis]
MTEFEPNAVARQIIVRLEEVGFTVKVADAPHRSVWEVTLDKPGTPWFGVLHVSARKGRALRITLTWHTAGRPHATRKVEGARDIRALINQVTPRGWEIKNA